MAADRTTAPSPDGRGRKVRKTLLAAFSGVPHRRRGPGPPPRRGRRSARPCLRESIPRAGVSGRETVPGRPERFPSVTETKRRGNSGAEDGGGDDGRPEAVLVAHGRLRDVHRPHDLAAHLVDLLL